MEAASCGRLSLPIQKNFKAHLSNWRLYALAGGAAVATDTRATADVIVYQHIESTLSAPNNGSNRRQIALNTVGGAARNLAFAMNINYHPATTFFGASVPAQGAALLIGDTSGVNHNYPWMDFYHANGANSLVKTFARGAVISGSQRNRFGGLALQTNNNNFSIGTGIKYIGFHTGGGGNGWMRVSVTTSGGIPNSMRVIDLAYNASGGGITAGQGLPSSAVPEPGSMALAILAAGATGLVALRKAKAQVAAGTAA